MKQTVQFSWIRIERKHSNLCPEYLVIETLISLSLSLYFHAALARETNPKTIENVKPLESVV